MLALDGGRLRHLAAQMRRIRRQPDARHYVRLAAVEGRAAKNALICGADDGYDLHIARAFYFLERARVQPYRAGRKPGSVGPLKRLLVALLPNLDRGGVKASSDAIWRACARARAGQRRGLEFIEGSGSRAGRQVWIPNEGARPWSRFQKAVSEARAHIAARNIPE
jgi:hypothetical protein